jgi:triosephosphate isomerase
MKYIVANWKMKLNLEEITRWLYDFEKLLQNNPSENTIVLAPTALHAERVSHFANKHPVASGLQDISSYEKGSHTGEVGAFQAADYATYCIVGHSERKEELQEVLEKRDLCLLHGITPIVCFINPDDVHQYFKEGCLLAWEDPDNISKGGVYHEKDPQEIEETFAYLKKELPEAIILYGGSVHQDNVGIVSQISGLDGVLVGNASLDPKHFMKLIEAF